MKASKVVSYNARHEYLGERAATWAVIEGTVQLEKLPKDNKFKAKMAVHAETFERETDERLILGATFDGNSVRTRKDSEKVVVETTFAKDQPSSGLGAVSRLIGGNLGRLILWDFLDPVFKENALIQYLGKLDKDKKSSEQTQAYLEKLSSIIEKHLLSRKSKFQNPNTKSMSNDQNLKK